MDLRCGRWQNVLADVEPDSIISDPPYSPKVHSGFRCHGDFVKDAQRRFAAQKNDFGKDGQRRHGTASFGGLQYEPLSTESAEALAQRYRPAWWVLFGDHITFRTWEAALLAAGEYVFAPVVWHRTGGTPRFQGDGPASVVEWICVARPRKKTTVGSLPGIYSCSQVKNDSVLKGQKPLALMQDIIRDYSKPGDLILDPFAGSGTTLLAAAIEGRRAIGSECDPATYSLAVKRLSKGYTPRMQLPAKAKPRQGDLGL